MKLPLLLSFLLVTLSASSQVNTFELINELYSKWEKSPNKCDTFLYSEKIDNYTIEMVKDQFLSDLPFIKFSLNKDTTNAEKIIFDSSERKYIIDQLNLLNSTVWPNTIFPKSNVIAFSKIDSIQKSVNERKLDPILRLCYSVHFFSKPIFLRQNTICLFYTGTTDFAMKEGEFWIYKKDNTKWEKYSPIYRWLE